MAGYVPELGYEQKLYEHKGVCFLIFGGFYDVRKGIAPFEFANVFEGIQVDRIHFRDVTQTWYQSGIIGISYDLAGVIDYIQALPQSYSRVVAVGNSMGGYAALLFGLLCDRITEVIAFSPQTVLDGSLPDPRWAANFSRACQIGLDDRFLNLSLLTGSEKRMTIYYGDGDAMDMKHVSQFVATHPQCQTITVVQSTHSRMIRELHAAGLLKKILSHAYKAGSQTDLFPKRRIVLRPA